MRSLGGVAVAVAVACCAAATAQAFAFVPAAPSSSLSRYGLQQTAGAAAGVGATSLPVVGGRRKGVVVAMAGDRAQVVQDKGLANIQKAKSFVQAGMGIEDPSLLSDDFYFLDPLTGAESKKAYVANAEKLNLRAAFPDLDYRAHDFRADTADPSRVWFTTRTTGTHKGRLVLYDEEIAPTGIKSFSVVIDGSSGKVSKCVGNIVMDRSVGNSAGLGGLFGVAAALGRPVSAFKHTPPQKVFQDFFGRTFKPSTAAPPVFSPLPEAVMIGLARGLVASDFGAVDPGLLAKDFKFVGPLVGPLNKDTFVKAFSSFNLRRAFPDINNRAFDFRVDPYDPTRVWFTVQSSGTFTGAFGEGKNSLPPNGAKYQGGPECVSVSFNGQGQCVKLTVGVLMDPDLGSTGGLGGVFGVLYGVGVPLPPFVTRPLPQHLRHWKNYFLDALFGPAKKDSSSASAPAASTKASSSSSAEPAKVKAAAPSSSPVKVSAVAAAPSPKPAAAPKVELPKVQVPSISLPKPKAPTPTSAPPKPAAKPVAAASTPAKPAAAAPAKPAVPKPATPTPAAPKATSSTSSSNPFASFFGVGGGKKEEASPPPAAKAPPATKAAAGAGAAAAPKKPAAAARAAAPVKKPAPAPAAPASKPAPSSKASPPKAAAAPAAAASKAAASPSKPAAAAATASKSSNPFGGLFGGGGKKSTEPPKAAAPAAAPKVQPAASRPKAVGSPVKAAGFPPKKK